MGFGGGATVNREDDQELVQNARPFLRGIIAVLFALRFGQVMKSDGSLLHDMLSGYYKIADHFIDQLDKDLKA